MTLTFSEWYEFNFVTNKIMDHFGDMYIKVFRKYSYKNEDRCFAVLMRIDDAVRMFGEYRLFKIKMHVESREVGEYKALCALLCPMEATAED